MTDFISSEFSFIFLMRNWGLLGLNKKPHDVVVKGEDHQTDQEK